MTDQDLRTALRDLAVELTAEDQPLTGVARAWSDGAARARRGRLAVVGSAVAVAAAVTGVVVLNEPHDNPDSTLPVDGPSSPAFQLPGGTRPDGVFQGTRVFWGPTVEQESRLPELSVGRPALPAEIDLSASAEAGPIDHAVAAFGLGNEDGTDLETVRLLAEDGTWRDLDVDNLEPVADEGGNSFAALQSTSLSPSGTRLAFVQPDRLVIYDVASQAWTDVPWDGVESFAWEDDDHLLIPGIPQVRSDVVALDGRVTSNFTLSSGMPDQQSYGPKVRGWIQSMGGYYQDAMAYFSVEGVPVPAGAISNPEVAWVSVGDDPPLLLVWPDSLDDRAKGCCGPATWLPSGEIVFHLGDRLLSWAPGTHDFHRVSSIVGRPDGSFAIASWADLSH